MRNVQFALLLVAIGCGSGGSSRLSLQLTSSDSRNSDSVSSIELRAGETRNVVLIAVGTDAPVTFAGRDLPGFAKLEGPVLTLAPQRADSGEYALTLIAQDGRESSSAALRLHVLRSNTAPRWSPQITLLRPSRSLGDDVYGARYACPGPTSCTAVPNSFVQVYAFDTEGDGIVVDLEVVPRGQPFAKKPTFSASAPAVYPPPSYGNQVNLRVYMPGLTPEQSYDFAVRVRDQLGAIAEVAGAPDGWYSDPQLGFDQGPCTARQCAGWPTGGPCEFDLDCLSRVCDKSVPAPYGLWQCK